MRPLFLLELAYNVEAEPRILELII
jgi:hypothetical protein